MITHNKSNFFKYIGAIYLAETSFITACASWDKALKSIFSNIDTRYFKEHSHIDTHHSNMAMNTLVIPAIEKYGSDAAKEIIRGFEEVLFISEIAENDFLEQTKWIDKKHEHIKTYQNIYPKVKQAENNGDISYNTFKEPQGELSVTHTHDEDELCHIKWSL